MQKLHLVGFTATFDGLIFSARKGAKSGSFVVPIDAVLLKQLAEADRLRDGGSTGTSRVPVAPRLVRPESALTPREMQDHIRGGWTVDEVALEAGVDLDWVRRFAAPVLAEVGRVIERAQAQTYDRPRVGLSALPLEASVRRNVADRGVRLSDDDRDDAWAAWQLDDERWVVRFTYRSRGRAQEAEWIFEPATGELVSRNRLAAQLGHVASSRRRPSGTTAKKAGPTKRQPAAATRAPARKKAAPTKKKAAPAKRAPATKAAPVKRAPAKKAAPVKRAPVKKAAPAKKAAAKGGAAKKRAPRAAATPTPARAAARPANPARPAPSASPLPVRRRDDLPDVPDWLLPGANGPLTNGPVTNGNGGPPAPAVPVVPVVELAPRPGAVAVDEETGVARIDSRRSSHVTPPAPPDVPPPAPRRRGEPLRAR
jgi:hypothetical protein